MHSPDFIKWLYRRQEYFTMEICQWVTVGSQSHRYTGAEPCYLVQVKVAITFQILIKCNGFTLVLGCMFVFAIVTWNNYHCSLLVSLQKISYIQW